MKEGEGGSQRSQKAKMEINHILVIKCGLNVLLQSYTNCFPIIAHIFHFGSNDSLLGAMAEIDVQEGSFQYVSSQ